jgi:rSAM/selenodomain-associated transferase 1
MKPVRTTSRSSSSIIVVAKSPVPGRVKTRLCPPCTQREAADIAEAALADTLETVSETPARARVLALDGAPGPWIPDGFVIVPQLGSGLDERLANAFAAVTGPAVLIGMDTPHVSRDLLVEAMATLRESDVDAVLGRASDGGWWGIGLRRADPRVFCGVPMSTDHTGADQLARLRALGCRTRLLDELQDVDTFADALAVASLIPDSRFATVVKALRRTENATA